MRIYLNGVPSAWWVLKMWDVMLLEGQPPVKVLAFYMGHPAFSLLSLT